MNPRNSPEQQRTLGYAIGLMLAGVIVIVSHTTPATDRQEMVFMVVLGGTAALFGIYYLFRFWRGLPTDLPMTAAEQVHLMPAEYQIPYLQRILTMSLVAFPVLTLYITFELTRLERGQADAVMIWAPISMLYRLLGYWPAVCATPALGIFCFFALNNRLKKLSSGDDRKPKSDDITKAKKIR